MIFYAIHNLKVDIILLKFSETYESTTVHHRSPDIQLVALYTAKYANDWVEKGPVTFE